MRCKFCDENRPLIKAHILPAAFFTFNDARILSSSPEVHPKKSRIGVYDENILCAECDGSFGLLDQHVVEKILRKEGRFHSDGEFGLRHYIDAASEIVRLFALSVAWRAHHSTHAMFANVNLGPHEGPIKRDLLNPIEHRKVSAFVHEFDHRNIPIISPIPERYDKVRFLRIYAGRLILSVKVDQRPMPPDLDYLDLLTNEQTISIVVPWTGSAEASLAIDIISGSEHNRRLANKWRKENASDDPMSVFRISIGRSKFPSN
ncbi:hypothetical protein [Rhizobium sp. 22-785-1]